MNKKFIYGISIMSMMFTITSCGGGEEESTEEIPVETIEVETEVVEPVAYTVDTANSVINWNNFDEGEPGHTGTVKVLEGSYTAEGDLITDAALTIDMNSLTCDSDKLLAHLGNEEFFDINKYASAAFNFDRHEEGMIYGTLNAGGLEFAVEAPVTVGDGTVEIGEFKIDMSQLPYFVTEKTDAPEDEWHDTNIGFSAMIVGNTSAE